MNCPICSQGMTQLFTFKDLPVAKTTADLAFMYCELCSHGSLAQVVEAPGDLVTGKSESATKCIQVFAEFVKAYCKEAHTVIDIGGNDSSLLEMFDGVQKVCIDPVVGRTIEETDLTPYRFPKKLVLSSHTIEHLKDPNVMIGKVSEILRDGDYLALQFPSLDVLVDDCRFDQVFHQHLHYFSVRSICKLLIRHGIGVVAIRFNYDHWGSLMVIAKKGFGRILGKEITWLDIGNSRIAFELEMMACNMRLKKGDFVAYGYGPMFDVLNYHIPSLKNLQVVDDDPEKNKAGGLADRNVVISAISSKRVARQLMAKAWERGARNVILPLQTA